MEEGKRVSPSVPYGYYRNPNNKQELLVDKESAKVVKRIYRLIIEGYGVTQIADILTKDKVLIPSAYAEIHYPENNHTTFLDNKTELEKVKAEIESKEEEKEKYKKKLSQFKNQEKKLKRMVRNFIIALPKELSFEENKNLIPFDTEKFCIKRNDSRPCHTSGNDEGNGNIHAHIMTTVRPLNRDGTWGAKSKKEYLLDE